VEARNFVLSLIEEGPEDVSARKLLRRIEDCIDSEGRVRLSEAELGAWTGVLDMREK